MSVGWRCDGPLRPVVICDGVSGPVEMAADQDRHQAGELLAGLQEVAATRSAPSLLEGLDQRSDS